MMSRSGVLPGSLPELRPLLKKWIDVNREYVDRCVGLDAPWWFNERASLSTVAAAAWLADGIALEEYTAPKIPPGAAGPNLSDRCRCDLFLSVKRRGGPGRFHDFITEAKIIWPDLAGQRLDKQVEAGLRNVRKDVRRTMNDGFSRRLGLLLISPYLKRWSADDFERQAKMFIGVLRGLESTAAVAWFFATEPHRLKWRKTGEYFPGTALVITQLRRQ